MERFRVYDDGYDVGILDTEFEKTDTNSESDAMIIGPFAAIGDERIRNALEVIVDRMNNK